MRRNRNFWLWASGLLLLFAGAAHWGFRLYLESQLERFGREARPGLEIGYQRLESSLLGEMKLRKVEIRSGSLPAPLRVEQLEIRGPSVIGYLFRNNPLAGTGPPRFLQLFASGMQMDLAHAGPPGGDECSLDRGLSPRLLRKLGYGELQGGLAAAYRYHAGRDLLEGTLNLDIAGIQEFAAEVKLQNVTPEGFRRGQLGTAALSEATLRLDVNPTFGKRLVEYCAARDGFTPDEFESLLVETLLAQLRRSGVLPGADLEAALLRYVRNWGSLEVSLVPPVPMNLVFLPFVPNEQLQRKLGLEVLINGEPVKGMRFGEVRHEREQRGRAAGAAAAKPRLARKRWRYRRVDPSLLFRYIGHRVKLREAGDPVRTGVLVEIADGEALVQQRLSGGKFLAYVSLDELVSAEVFVPQRQVQ